jgi:hypothetical protein
VLIDVSGSSEAPTIIASVLSSSTREIDAKGWYAQGAVLGVLFTEFGGMRDAVDAAGEAIVGRLHGRLSGLLGDEAIQITAHTLPTGRSASEIPRRRGKDVVSPLHERHFRV